jgi:hypothetical protein
MEFNELLRRAEKALIDLDAEALVAAYAPEFFLEDTASGNRISNKTELRKYYDRLFALPDISFTDVRFFTLGERAAGQWTWCGRSKSGQKFTIRGASLFKLGEDGIREETLYYDPKPVDT